MYTILFIYILPLVALLKTMNLLRVSNESLRAKYHFDELHSRLLFLAIADKAYRTDEHFLFLDTALQRASVSLKKLNLWVILYMILKDWKEDKYILFPFETNFDHDENLSVIYNDYTETTMYFFQSKSKYSLLLFGLLLRMGSSVKSSFRRTRDSSFITMLNRKIQYILISDGAFPIPSSQHAGFKN
jgi:hypothetical protein